MPVNKFGDSGGDNNTAIFTTSSSIGVTMSQLNNVFLRREGANNATGELNMSGHKVANIATPSSSGDATSKSYVDSYKFGLCRFRRAANKRSECRAGGRMNSRGWVAGMVDKRMQRPSEAAAVQC